jgi:hypothetical protein
MVSALELALATGASLEVNLTLRDKFDACLSCRVSVAAGCSVTAIGPSFQDHPHSHFTIITIHSTADTTDDSTTRGLMVQDAVPSSSVDGVTDGATGGVTGWAEGSAGSSQSVRVEA